MKSIQQVHVDLQEVACNVSELFIVDDLLGDDDDELFLIVVNDEGSPTSHRGRHWNCVIQDR